MLTIFSWFGFLYPVGEMANKIEEEVTFRHADYCTQQEKQFEAMVEENNMVVRWNYGSARIVNTFVSDLHKQTKTFRILQAEMISNVLTEVLGSGARVHFKGLQAEKVCIRERQKASLTLHTSTIRFS
jgi:hypothetical protein